MTSDSPKPTLVSWKQRLENSLKVAAIASALFLGIPAIAETETAPHAGLPVVMESFSPQISSEQASNPGFQASKNHVDAVRYRTQTTLDDMTLFASAETNKADSAVGTAQKDPEHVVLDEVLDLVRTGKLNLRLQKGFFTSLGVCVIVTFAWLCTGG
jgi:hypothetical protein